MALVIDGMAPLLQVFDMPTSLHFYRDILGFAIVADSGDGDESSWVWLRLNGVDLMLNDQYEPGSRPERPPAERVKWHNDTCLYFSSPDPEAAFVHLRGAGLDPEPPKTTPYGMKQLYISDPDGYNLCFQCSADPG